MQFLGKYLLSVLHEIFYHTLEHKLFVARNEFDILNFDNEYVKYYQS